MDRLMLRCAQRLQHTYEQLDQSRRQLGDPPHQAWDLVELHFQQLRLAEERGWNGASRRITNQLCGAVSTLEAQLRELRNSLANRHAVDQSTPTLLELVTELAGLRDEFPEVRYEPRTSQVVVVTEPIVLDDVTLGAFEIVLTIDDVNGEQAYIVRALEPFPAQSDDEVVHPHVRDECLCEGDGRRAVRRALESGRLCDFFQIVARILASYNEDSAYVTLDRWQGEPCHSCGDLTTDETRYPCDRCNVPLCGVCAGRCEQCEASLCHSCSQVCAACEDSCCSRCTRPCSECGRPTCKDCLRTGGLCADCVTSRSNQENLHECVTPDRDSPRTTSAIVRT